MRYQFNDLLMELDDGAKVTETADGYLVGAPKVARTGIQLYRGSEVGVTDKSVVRIYRPPEEVFSADSMASFAYKPITDDHPPVMVDQANWKDYAKGNMGGEVLRDGDAIRVPMVLMDGRLIKKYKDGGKRQLSAGYTCDIDMTPGTTPAGEQYDGRQVGIRINHTAFVKAGRAGPEYAFGDAATSQKLSDAVGRGVEAIREGRVVRDKALEEGDQVLGFLDGEYPFMKDGSVHIAALQSAQAKAKKDGRADVEYAAFYLLGQVKDGNQQEMNAMKTMIVDGITCEMSDTAIQVVQRFMDQAKAAQVTLQSQLDTLKATSDAAVKDKEGQIAKLTTDLAAAVAKTATLETQLKDAVLTPDKLDGLVKDRQIVADKAKVLFPAVVVDGKSIEDVMKQVVDAKLGDAAKDWKPEQIRVSFDTLAAAVSVGDAGVDRTRTAFSHQPHSVAIANDAARDKLYDDRDKQLENAWKAPASHA